MKIVALSATAAGLWLAAGWSPMVLAVGATAAASSPAPLLAVWLIAAIEWTSILVGIISGLFGTVAVAGTIWVARRQYSGTARTASGDGALQFAESFMKLQADGITRYEGRIAVLESKVEELRETLSTERTTNLQLELDNAALRAEVARLKAERA